MKQIFVLLLLMAVSMISCTVVNEGDCLNRQKTIEDIFNHEVLFSAFSEESELSTKSSRINKKIYWGPQDSISIFYGPGEDGGTLFISTNEDYATKTTFRGTIDVITGLTEGSDEIKFWGVFPYDVNNSCVEGGSAVLIRINSNQVTDANSFGRTQNIAIGRSDGLAMSFNNLCGGFVFCVKQQGIKKIIFKGNDNQTIAGQVKVKMNSTEKPVISQFLGDNKEITITPSNEFTPINGNDTTWFYVVLPPTAFDTGYTFTLYNHEGKCLINSITEGYTIKRNTFKWLRTALDEEGTWEEEQSNLEKIRGGDNPDIEW